MARASVGVTSAAPADVLARQFDGLTPDPRILALETHQPEFSKPVSDYVRGVISDERVAIGRRKLEQLTWLPDIQRRYGPPPEILLAIWAVETAFGTIQGGNDALRCLATLAASGHRQDWAETQIIALFQIMAAGDATRAQLKGSWTGALGQPQFEPTQYLSTAVDGDGDGRIEIVAAGFFLSRLNVIYSDNAQVRILAATSARNASKVFMNVLMLQ